MHRHYYVLKAVVIVFALGVAGFGYMFGSRDIDRTYTRSHYSAATTFQVTADKAGAAVGHAILRVVEFFDR
jgi:hypothetical protein